MSLVLSTLLRLVNPELPVLVKEERSDIHPGPVETAHFQIQQDRLNFQGLQYQSESAPVSLQFLQLRRHLWKN